MTLNINGSRPKGTDFRQSIQCCADILHRWTLSVHDFTGLMKGTANMIPATHRLVASLHFLFKFLRIKFQIKCQCFPSLMTFCQRHKYPTSDNHNGYLLLFLLHNVVCTQLVKGFVPLRASLHTKAENMFTLCVCFQCWYKITRWCITLHGSETPQSHHCLQLCTHKIRNQQLNPPKKSFITEGSLTLQTSWDFLHLLKQVLTGWLMGKTRHAGEGGWTELTSESLQLFSLDESTFWQGRYGNV